MCPRSVPARPLDRLDRELLVHLAGHPAHADRADPVVSVEHRDAPEEEREERVEARPLDGILARLLRELARRRRVAARGRIGLALRVIRVSGAAPSIVAAATSSPCVSATNTETGPVAFATTSATIACALASRIPRYYDGLRYRRISR